MSCFFFRLLRLYLIFRFRSFKVKWLAFWTFLFWLPNPVLNIVSSVMKTYGPVVVPPLTCARPACLSRPRLVSMLLLLLLLLLRNSPDPVPSGGGRTSCQNGEEGCFDVSPLFTILLAIKILIGFAFLYTLVYLNRNVQKRYFNEYRTTMTLLIITTVVYAFFMAFFTLRLYRRPLGYLIVLFVLAVVHILFWGVVAKPVYHHIVDKEAYLVAFTQSMRLDFESSSGDSKNKTLDTSSKAAYSEQVSGMGLSAIEMDRTTMDRGEASASSPEGATTPLPSDTSGPATPASAAGPPPPPYMLVPGDSLV
ncbi:hypothetical protein H696_01616 [Fonticula alba]|uniref:Uncharacterized protein n=1 Tax=Fonticula alba TaxID=691883 RepID=A0A058ZE39_FONAL|nr:hypothetical protein H696_01616 [Fonticula alba]KCV72216.1 hypothetical protein H696_01616 [Fonticula alba]|eukprot:XP_009493794.1 hypothetical protein H696_01616 [Fonticula alba]